MSIRERMMLGVARALRLLVFPWFKRRSDQYIDWKATRGSLAARFLDAQIELPDYPFPPSDPLQTRTIEYTSIREIDPDAMPPEIRTTDGEVLFVTAEQKDELREAARTHAIPIVRRVEVWYYILQPCLDTQFDDDEKEETLRRLERCGISREECHQIRHFVKRAMYAYNIESCLWEWVHLGLYDVLCALRGSPRGRCCKLPDDEFNRFYERAMELANKGTPIEEEIENRTPGT